MLEVMKRLSSKNISAEETLLPIGGKGEFWHCSIVDQNEFPVSGGFGENRELARKIAIAEYLERENYRKIALDKTQHKEWGLDLVSTACGFAAGFSRENTILRSIAEAHERWALSKWIDEDFLIEEISFQSVQSNLDPASEYFFTQFDNVLFFKKNLIILVAERYVSLEIAATAGLKNGGIFLGSAAQLAGGNPWQHALLESFRHLLAFKNNPKKENAFPSNKIQFFASNADIALEQIRRQKKEKWPNPMINFHRCVHKSDGNYFIARTIVDGWNPWNQGPLERFLY